MGFLLIFTHSLFLTLQASFIAKPSYKFHMFRNIVILAAR